MKKIAFVFFLLLAALNTFAQASYQCILKGEVIGRDSKVLYLAKATDKRVTDKKIINIQDHQFEYKFQFDQTEAYELIFEDEHDKGSWHSIVFFPTEGPVSFKLFATDKADDDLITGGELNSAFTSYLLDRGKKFNNRQKLLNSKVDSLYKRKLYYVPERDSLIKLTRTEHSKVDPAIWRRLSEMDRNGEAYTPQGKLVKLGWDALNADQIKSRYEYINNNKDFLSYYLLVNDVNYQAQNNAVVLANIRKAYPEFAAKYPLHPYTSIIANVLNGFKIKAGSLLIDVTLPDVLGKPYQLSDLSKGKVTLIDFWGSWCGPCIANTRTMLPVYNEFKDKGFTIVGIAKEYKTTKDLKSRLKKEKYPWINLVEMDDKNEIWNKFGITNSTGMMLLVNKDGKILDVDPTAADVRKHLLTAL